MSASTISDFVLVPMEAQAVVVNDQVLAGVPFVNGTYNYENVPRFQTPAPAPFDDVGTPPEKGVHLLWEMPAAFRQGTQKNDTIEFPLVPNRWLVLRYWPGQSTGNRQVKGWVLQSDYIGADGTNSFLDPNAQTPTPTKLGKSMALSDFTEPSTPLFLKGIAPGNLTFSSARMNAQDVFSFCDELTDITLQSNQTVYLSYLVVGWYSDPAQDPLNGANDTAAWAARMAELHWVTDPSPYAIAGASPPQQAFGIKGYGDLCSHFAPGTTFTVTGSTGNNASYTVAASGPVWDATDSHLTIPVTGAIVSSMADGYIVPPGAPGSWPTQSLTHGLLYNVGWQNFKVPPRPNSEPKEISANVKIAIGNSAIDALGAMIVAEAKASQGEDDDAAQADAAALEAFQANMLAELDKPGGQAQLDQQLRGKWFEPDDGGTLWKIVTNPEWVPTGSTFEPNLTQEQWLAKINYYQQGLDRETRVLETMQYQLYALWWRTQSINAGSYTKPLQFSDQQWYQGIPQRQIPAIKDQITATLPAEAAAVDAQIQNVALWQGKVSILVAAPPSYQSGTTTVSILIPDTAPANPAPPLLLKAVKMPRYYAPVDPVVLISGLGTSVNLTNKTTAGQESLPCRLGSQAVSALAVNGTAVQTSSLASHVATPSAPNLPAGVASATAVLALESILLDPDNASLIASISGQSAAAISAAIRAGNAYTGVAPDPISATQWQQAWVPILLDWNVTWYPTVSASVIDAGNTPNWRFDREGWAFDGLDYNWIGGDISQPLPGPGMESFTIASVNVAARSFTVAGVGNLGWRFPSAANGNAAYFNVSGGTTTYHVQSTTCDAAGNFTIVVDGAVTSAQVGQKITPQVLPGWAGGISYKGRTFLTPKATFNFRARLEQYVKSHGGRYSIAGADPASSSFTVETTTDLSAFFVTGSTFYVAQSTANNAAYIVASCTFDSAAKKFTLVSTQKVPSAIADGVLISQPLADAAHLIDIIGGARFTIVGVDSGSRSVTLSTNVDLNHLFGVGGIFYLAETEHSNGVYTVASTSYDETGATFTVVTVEALPQSAPYGVAVPEPQEWDLLSQSLGGFTEQLLMRDLEPNQIPNGMVGSGPASGKSYGDLVDEQNHTLPMLSLGDAIQPAQGSSAPYYFPIRGGYFALRNLALVDRFGQKIDLLFANQNNQAASPQDAWQSFGPIRSRWVTPESNTQMSNPTRLIKMPPRSGLAGRLDFRFVSAPDNNNGGIPRDTDIDLVAGASPVAGWVLPNHLDNGLLVYDAEGTSLGELVLSRTGTTPSTTVRWFPVPMAETPIVDPLDPVTGIPNQYLRGFVAGLLNFDPNKRGDAFANFLQAVDETLWAVDPLGGRSDQNLSVLVGRPLALVRSRLKLLTDGPPIADQSTVYTIPYVFTISAADSDGGSFSFPMTVNLAETGRFEPGSTVKVSGSPGNDGVYHIIRTAFDGSSTFTVFVEEAIPNGTAGGNLAARPPEGGLTNTPFTLRLGRSDLYDDGLIGYYVGDDYSKCYNVHALDDFTPTGYLCPVGQNGGNYLSVSYYAESTQGGPPDTPPLAADPHSIFVTMLVDPRGTVNATTGILPTEELTLPAEFYQDAIAKLEIYFRTGPLLVDADAIRMPRPTEQQGTWSWIQKNDPSNVPASWEADPITKDNDQASFPAQPLQLRDGWLKLTGAALKD